MGTCTGGADGRGSCDDLRDGVVGGLTDGVADDARADLLEVLQPFQLSIILASKALSCQCTHESRLTCHSKGCIQRKSCIRVFKESQEGAL